MSHMTLYFSIVIHDTCMLIISFVFRYFFSFPIKVPTGLAAFPNELSQTPESVAALKYQNIVQYTDMPSGGHFAALQEPALLAKDIFSFLAKVENGPNITEN